MKKITVFIVTVMVVVVSISNINCQKAKETFKDSRDCKIYKTVKIGKQVWMAENLSYKANNGCWAYEDDDSNVDKYGYLYNFETAKTVCPSGWHLPSDAELTELINYLGGYKFAGKKLKSATGWKLYGSNNYGNNESGFNALPGGYRLFSDGSFYYIGEDGAWWSSTLDGKYVSGLALPSDHIEVPIFRDDRRNGLSVRCLKD